MKDNEGEHLPLRALAWHVLGVPFGFAGIAVDALAASGWLHGVRDRCWFRSMDLREAAAERARGRQTTAVDPDRQTTERSRTDVSR